MGGRGSSSMTRGVGRSREGVKGGKPSEKLLNAPWQHYEGAKVSVGWTAKEAEKKITQNDYETGIVINPDGFVVAAYKGGKHSVNFGNDSNLVRGNTITHNHPSGAAVFSMADIETSGALGANGIRASTKNNGTAYIRMANQRGDFAGFAGAYKSAMPKLDEKAATVLRNGGTMKQYNKVDQDWYRSNAKKFNLKFSSER